MRYASFLQLLNHRFDVCNLLSQLLELLFDPRYGLQQLLAPDCSTATGLRRTGKHRKQRKMVTHILFRFRPCIVHTRRVVRRAMNSQGAVGIVA